MVFSNPSSPGTSDLLVGTLNLITSFGEALDHLEDAICLFDSEDRCIYWNRTFLTLFPEHEGYVHEGEPYRENLRRFYARRLNAHELPLIETYVDAGIARHRAQTRPYSFEHNGQHILVTSFPLTDGSRVRIWRTRETTPIHDGDIPLSLASGESPTSVKYLLDQIPDGLMICGLDGCINWVNKTFVEMYNLPDRTLALGMTFEAVFRLVWANRRSNAQNAMYESGLKSLNENMRFNGAPFELPLPGKKFVRIIGSPTSERSTFYAHVDISELKRQQQLLADAELAARRDSERAYYLATHDTLTSLPNRMLANERLNNSFLTLKRSRIVYAVMILDIDHFKTINDSHGHAVGDQVLHQIADVLRNAVRESDFVARIGGEEFLVLLPATGLNEARMVAEKIRLAVESTRSPTGGAITISIGVAIASPDDGDEDVCVVKADNMLYEAKRAGRNRVMCFGT